MFRVLIAAVFVCLAAAIGAAPLAQASGPYANCTQAHQDGRWDIPQDDPDYWPAGDRDHDGIACES
jgi:excalibur calcium-binding domain-containing protein